MRHCDDQAYILIQHGARIDMWSDKKERTYDEIALPLEVTCQTDDLEMVQLLLQHINNVPTSMLVRCLHIAGRATSARVFNALLERWQLDHGPVPKPALWRLPAYVYRAARANNILFLEVAATFPDRFG